MAVYTPNRSTGEVMGSLVRQRLSKSDKRAFRIKEKDEEEHKISLQEGRIKSESEKFREVVRMQRKGLGLE